MGLSEILGNIKDASKKDANPSMDMSKKLKEFTSSSGKSFDKLIKIQEKSPIQKRQLAMQQNISQKATMTNMKIDSLTKLTQAQTKLMEQNQKVLLLSSKYLETIDKGLSIDRRDRRLSEDEEKRYRRKSRDGKFGFKDKNKDKKPDKKGIFDWLLDLLGLNGFGAGLATMWAGSKIGKFFTSVGGLFKTISTGVRSFLFGTKYIDEVTKVVTKTNGIFGVVGKVGTSVFNFLGKSVKTMYNLSIAAGKFIKLPQLASGALNSLKNIPLITQGLNAIKSSSLVTKGMSAGRSVINAGKSAYSVAKPAISVVGKAGGKVLSLGGKALSGITNFLAPTAAAGAKVGLKVGGGVLSKMLPGVGAALSAATAFSDFQKGDYLGTAINGLAAITNFLGPLGMLVSGVLTVVDMVRKGEIQALFQSVKDTFSSVGKWVSDKVTAVGDWFKGIGDGIVNIFTTATTWWTDKFNQVRNFFSNLGSTFLTSLGSVGTIISGIGTSITGVFSTVTSTITGALGSVGTAIGDMATKTWETITGFTGGIWDTAKSLFSDAFNKVSDYLSPSKFVKGIENWLMSTTWGAAIVKLAGGGSSSPTTSDSGGGADTSAGGNSSTYTPTLSTTSDGAYNVTSNSTNSFTQATLKAVKNNETSNPLKISKDNVGYAVGAYQHNSSTNPKAWQKMGVSNADINAINNGNQEVLARVQKQLLANPEMVYKLDREQEAGIMGDAKKMVQLLGQQGFTFSSPSVIAQFADIYNNFGTVDKKLAPKLLEQFSKGKLITPDTILKYRLYRADNGGKGTQHDKNIQTSRHKNVEKEFANQGNQKLSANQLMDKFNSQAPMSTSSPVQLPPSATSVPSTPNLIPTPQAGPNAGAMPNFGAGDSKQQAKAKAKAKAMASQASLVESTMAGSGRCYEAVGKMVNGAETGINVNADGGSRRGSAYMFSDYALNTNHGRNKLDRVFPSFTEDGKLSGIQPGDIIVWNPSTAGTMRHHPIHGHIEVMGADGSAYSDYKNAGAADFRAAVKKGLVQNGQVKVFRLKGAGGAGSIPPELNPVAQTDANGKPVEGANTTPPVPVATPEQIAEANEGLSLYNTIKEKKIEVADSDQNLNFGKVGTEGLKEIEQSVFGTAGNTTLPMAKDDKVVNAPPPASPPKPTKDATKPSEKKGDDIKKKTVESAKKTTDAVKKTGETLKKTKENKNKKTLAQQKALEKKAKQVQEQVKGKSAPTTGGKAPVAGGMGKKGGSKNPLFKTKKEYDDYVLANSGKGLNAEKLTKDGQIVGGVNDAVAGFQSANPNAPVEDKLSTGWNNLGKGFLKSIGAEWAAPVLDVISNPIDMIGNIWNTGKALVSGDPKQMQAEMERQNATNPIAKLFSGDGKALSAITDVVSKTTGFDASGIVNNIQSGNVGGMAVDAISKATGFDVGSVLNNFGINSNDVVNSAMSSVTGVSTNPLDTKAGELMQKQAINESQVQGQITSTLSGIENASRQTTANTAPAPASNKSRTKPNLLNSSDLSILVTTSVMLG